MLNINRVKPIFLLTDREVLFYNEDGFILDRIKKLLLKEKNVSEIKAAYISASNSYTPQFYKILELAM